MKPADMTVLDIAGVAIAARIARAAGQGGRPPGLFWLSGFKSEMAGTKASALARWARERGRDCIRFDYSGHGLSGGDFEAGTIGRWLGEAEAVFAEFAQGPQIVVGSSMGGWLALLLARRLARAGAAGRVAAMVLIAPAADMTEALMWRKFDAAAIREIEETGRYLRPSAYGDGPYAITRKLIEEGRGHLVMGADIAPGCPVRILHGMDDEDVPWGHSLALLDRLEGDARLTLVPGGDHRLSASADLARLEAVIDALSDCAGSPASSRAARPSR